MRTTGFDKNRMESVAQNQIVEAIKKISCPKCHKKATNVSVKNGKIRFDACCDELKQKIMREVLNAE